MSDHARQTATPSRPPQPRIIGLDVARALAILTVLIGHCSDMLAYWLGGHSPEWVSRTSYFGVELFFVLSGLLIGQLLIRIIGERPSMRAWLVFMARRWMRTLPVYFLWIAVLAVLMPPNFWLPDQGALLWQYVLRYATLTQNLAWPMPEHPQWFMVSWSLSIEEWFYLTFSAALLLAVLAFGRRAGLWATVAVFLVAPALLRWQIPGGSDWGDGDLLRKAVVLRLDAIAFGVVLAWMQARNGWVFRHPRQTFAAGLTLILGLWLGWWPIQVTLNAHLWRTFLFDATSLGFALCLPAAAALRRLPRLPTALFTAISAQSYGMYITHLSLLELLVIYQDRWHFPVWLAIAAALPLIWAVSWASWHWIEAPILARRPRQFGPDESVLAPHPARAARA